MSKELLMKILLSALFLISSASAFANEFDNFVGDYTVSGAPTINADRATFCNHLDFKNLTGLTIAQDTKGYKQSHMIHFINASGWYGAPVMDFDYTNDWHSGGSFAKTTGNATSATNVEGSWGTNPITRDTVTITIEKTGGGYALSMQQAHFENSSLSAACYYQVALTKK